MEHFADKRFLGSEHFDIHILKNAMINDLDKLAEYTVTPLSKDDIDFYVIELYKGVQIFEQWLSCQYDKLDEDVKQELREASIERNRWFLTESHHDVIEKFYENRHSINNRIRAEVAEKLNAAC